MFDSLIFIELENELQKQTKELKISKETSQVTTGTDNSIYCFAIGVGVPLSNYVIICQSLNFIFSGT